eukprot:TRINITY_DN4688_c2_g1_i1.p1 TRINITY_DN4688_c2_g1~~TRINITY_DN4688_c2_g1_i1.p1  ORF type:complete len:766 (+),score=142.50 TRINITY_DN4688_c2_g1_i1:75-2372(+)
MMSLHRPQHPTHVTHHSHGMPSVSETPITKEGTLARKTSMWGKWTDKFFVLRGANLEEYKTKTPPGKKTKPDSVIPLAQVTIRAADGLTGQPLTFGIFGKKAKHTVFLRAPSKTDYNDWVHFLAGQSGEGSSVGSWKTTQKALDAFSKRDSVVCSTERGIIIGVNSIMEREFGWTKEELVGQNLTIFMAKNIGAVHDSYLARYNSTNHRRLLGKPRVLKGAVKKDGTPVTIELSLGEVFEGDQRRFIGTMRIVHNDEEVTDDYSPTNTNSTAGSDDSQWTDTNFVDSEHSSEESDAEFDDEFAKVENNIDSSIRALKQGVLSDLKEMKRHARHLHDELKRNRRDTLDIKRRGLRFESSNHAMRRILFTEWPSTELHASNPGAGAETGPGFRKRGSSIDHTNMPSECAGVVRVTPSVIRFDFMTYLKQMITNEIEGTKSVALLFRTDNDTTKLMTALTVAVGLEYLEETLGHLIRNMLKNKRVGEYSPRGSYSSHHGHNGHDHHGNSKKRQRRKKVGFELNPANMPHGEKRSRNIKNLTRYCNLFLANIVESLHACPMELRDIAHHTQKEVQRVFCSTKRSSKKHLLSVGGFMFLRYFCPAIIFPHQFGLVMPEDVPSLAAPPSDGASSFHNGFSAGSCPVVGSHGESSLSPPTSPSSYGGSGGARSPSTSNGSSQSSKAGSHGHESPQFHHIHHNSHHHHHHQQQHQQGSFVLSPHRGLIFVSKFLQNLANGTTFHADYEAELNDLINDKTPDVYNYLSNLASCS